MAAVACSGGEAGRVVLGDEQFDAYLPLLEGRRVAVFSNQTGIVGDVVVTDGLPAQGAEALRASLRPFGRPVTGPHVVDALIGKGVDVAVIFSPEHGFRGDADAGEKVDSGVDAETGVPIVSLYGGPGTIDTDLFDVLVVDIQDVGLRYYTYYVTMTKLIAACAEAGRPVVILDRPNPNGFYVDGPILDMAYKSGVGGLPIPIVHGMTLGELALMENGEGWIPAKADITVIPCRNYTHRTKYNLILAPSPNIKNMQAVWLYASTCYFEGTVVSLGRGTDWPFEVYGHPDMTGDFTFTPQSMDGAKDPLHLGEVCHGRDLRPVPDEEVWAAGINFEYVVDAYTRLGAGADFFIREGRFFDLLCGGPKVREMILAGASADQVKASWQEDVAAFKEQRRPYLLYAE